MVELSVESEDGESFTTIATIKIFPGLYFIFFAPGAPTEGSRTLTATAQVRFLSREQTQTLKS